MMVGDSYTDRLSRSARTARIEIEYKYFREFRKQVAVRKDRED